MIWGKHASATGLNVRLALLGLNALMLAAAGPVRAELSSPRMYHHVGIWDVSNAFDECEAKADFANDTSLLVGIRSNGIERLSVSNSTWTWLKQHRGEKLPMVFEFDTETLENEGEMNGVTLAIESFFDAQEVKKLTLLPIFAEARHVTITAGGKPLGQFELSDSRQVAEDLLACVREVWRDEHSAPAE